MTDDQVALRTLILLFERVVGLLEFLMKDRIEDLEQQLLDLKRETG